MSHSSSRWQRFVISTVCLASLSIPAVAQRGHMLPLVVDGEAVSAPAQTATKAARTERVVLADDGAATARQAFESLASVEDPLAAFSDVESANKTDESSGCRVTPSSPAIGADVPLTYFGVPSPGTNPSLVGAVQLLTSGPVDPAARLVTIPLYRGLLAGEDVWYIATDSTDESNAAALGINHSAKLAFGDTGRGARTATLSGDGLLTFNRGRVDFSPDRQVVPGPAENPFPPAVAQPGSVGDNNYSPLVKVLNAGGHIYNLPVMATGPEENLLLPDGTPNYDFVHDTVTAIDFENETVTLALAAGFSFGRPVLYISTDSNSRIAAALEGATLAPGLGDIDVGNDDSLFSAVERIFITINGPRGCDNPQRQGIEAALSDGEAPFNVLGGIPTIAPDYSPLWDANVGVWTQEAIDAGYRSRLIDEFQILSFVEFGFMTGLGGSDYGSIGIIINCPIVHRFL